MLFKLSAEYNKQIITKHNIKYIFKKLVMNDDTDLDRQYKLYSHIYLYIFNVSMFLCG